MIKTWVDIIKNDLFKLVILMRTNLIMDKYYKIRFSVPKNPIKGFFSLKSNNKIDAIISANKRLIEFKIDIQFEMIDEITQVEYYDFLNKGRYADQNIFSIN